MSQEQNLGQDNGRGAGGEPLLSQLCGCLSSGLQNHVKTTTAPYKYPRAIEFVDELPKTISGKVRRVELREREVKRYQEENEHQAE